MKYSESELDDLLKNNSHLRVAGGARKPAAAAQAVAPPKRKGRGVHKPGVMNATEARYASEVLDAGVAAGEVVWYSFESITLKIAFDTRYTPDFAVMLPDGEIEFHEVKAADKGNGGKARYEDDAKVKIKVAARNFPFHFKTAHPAPAKQGGGWVTTLIKH
jgi:hypothetical protein